MSSPEKSGQDRASLAVGLFASLMALYPFKEWATSVGFYFFGIYFSLYAAAAVFLIILFLATYFFGLNNIRYDYPDLIASRFFRWTKWVETVAYFLYALAFLFPALWFTVLVALFLVSEASVAISAVLPRNSEAISVFSIVISNALSIAAGIFSFFSLNFYSSKEKAETARLKERLEEYVAKGRKESTDGDLKLAILSFYQATELALRGFLLPHIGLGADRMPMPALINAARKLNIVTDADVSFLFDLRSVRNRIAHDIAGFNLTPGQISEMLTRSDSLLKNLEAQKARWASWDGRLPHE